MGVKLKMDWEYDDHPNRHSVTEKCREIQSRLVSCEDFRKSVILDTRPFHADVFLGVVPSDCRDFAGSYRGSKPSYLHNYTVSIGCENPDGSYNLVFEGSPPEHVELQMEMFHERLQLDLQNFEKLEFDSQKKVIVLANILSRYVVVFLSIHPYANGNGHVSRLIGWVVFLMKGFNIAGWDLDIRPLQPFDDYIKRYQDGDRGAMVSYFYNILITCELPS